MTSDDVLLAGKHISQDAGARVRKKILYKFNAAGVYELKP
jgi:hypothetical protein